MPYLELMGWVESEQRWEKRHQGTLRKVTPFRLKKLGLLAQDAPHTKMATLQAANEYWRLKEESLRSAAKPTLDETTAMLAGMAKQNPLESLRPLMDRSKAAEKLLMMLQSKSAEQIAT